MAEGRGGRGRNRRTRKKGRPGKRIRKAERLRSRWRATRRRRRAILARATAHPVRRRMLRTISERGTPLSPAQMAKAFDLPLGLVIYHTTVLHQCGALEVSPAKDG
jgi:hypothetical protein